MANSNRQMVLCVLGTSTIGISDAGSYDIIGKLSLPGISKGDPSNSQVVTVVSKNGSPILTSDAGAAGFLLRGVVLASGDTISVGMSSAANVDLGKNVVKCVVAIG